MKEIEKVENKPKDSDYEISKDEFGDLIEIIDNEDLIKGASVLRGGIVNHVQAVLLQSAKITMKGLDYLEENSTLSKTYRGLKEIKSWLSLS